MDVGNGCEEPSFLWQHEHGKRWISYSVETLETINKAYNKGQKVVTITESSSKQLELNFKKMIQKNKVSSYEQRIRCCIFDHMDENYYVWHWKDDDEFWYCYMPSMANELENCFKQKKKSVTFAMNGTNYEINLADFTQKNDETGFYRDVERMKVPLSKAEVLRLKNAFLSSYYKRKSKSIDAASTSNGVSAKKKGKKGESSLDEEKPVVKTVLLKGKAPVDSECIEKVGKAHVYFESNNVYDAMLNQTNLQQNNNKYYLMQLLEDDNAKNYDVWFRWGRVGKKGQSNLIKFRSDLESAKKEFEKKFYDKTRNKWENRQSFEKVAGKYDLLKMDYNTEEKVEKKSKAKKQTSKVPVSKLDPKVSSLIELICDIKLMEEAVMEMQYDAKKAPLGKLTVDQIKAGYAALKKIEECVMRYDKGPKLLEACNEFYTRIPHDFGMKTPPIIKTVGEIKLKMQLLEALGDIQIAVKMLSDEMESNQHPADVHYQHLECKLEPLSRNSSTFKLLEKYLINTHAHTHNQYKLEIKDIFECLKDGEEKNFKDVGNRVLLWHGSRLTNWVGILKKGLRIAPPEAPVTGYMFGKGIYFADMCTKSANYCFATQTKNEGLVLLCEVALGKQNELIDADSNASKLPKGKNSVKGLGRVAPDPEEDTCLPDGTKVPLGKPIDTGVSAGGFTLNYNEYIVYDINQVKMRYLVQVKFNFNY